MATALTSSRPGYATSLPGELSDSLWLSLGIGLTTDTRDTRYSHNPFCRTSGTGRLPWMAAVV